MPDNRNLPDADEPWQPALRQLQGQHPDEPSPFFYARLQARMAAEQAQPRALPWLLRRPAYATLLVILLLLLNLGAAIRYRQTQAAAAVPKPPANGYTAFVAEYQLASITLPRE
jgi:hypothetical protein